jgi:hypothetical protein
LPSLTGNSFRTCVAITIIDQQLGWAKQLGTGFLGLQRAEFHFHKLRSKVFLPSQTGQPCNVGERPHPYDGSLRFQSSPDRELFELIQGRRVAFTNDPFAHEVRTIKSIAASQALSPDCKHFPP